jgi:adenylate cyclase
MKAKRIGLATLLGLGVGILGAVCQFAGVFESLGYRLNDRFFLAREADTSVVIVAIDDASLGRIGRWPWPRSVHADLVDRLTAHGVKAIGYDVNFPEASDVRSDTRLAEAIRRSGRVVLPIELNFEIVNGRLSFASGRVVQPIAEIQSAAAASGFTNTPLDEDGIVRRVPAFVRDAGGSTVHAFSYEIARLADRAPATDEIPLDRFDRFLINFPGEPGRNFRIVAASDILQDRVDPAVFKDAVVFVGATARNLHDYQNVPTSRGEPMAGVEMHASIYDTLVNREWIRPVNPWIQALLLVLAGVLLGLTVPRIRPRYTLLGVFILWIAWIVTAFVFFDHGYVLDIVWPTLVLFFAYVVLVLERWLDTEAQKRDLRSAFGRYVSPSVVDSIIRDPDKLKLGGDRRRMTVLFSDLRGFTTLSEGLTPEKLVEVLNKYLDEMTNIVLDEGGVLDKYIGDAVMAFWNAPLDQPDHALRGVRCAVRMRDRLKAMNADGEFPKGIELKVGVGLNTGEMVVGNIGAELRFDYTVIGDSVNLASRTESLCKEYGAEILVTQNTVADLGDAFHVRLLDQVAVKGKKEPIRIYEVLGLAGEVSDQALAYARRFETALEHYFARRFDEALHACEALLVERPEDVTAKNLVERCRIYKETPPPPEWNGTWVMTKK